MGGLEVCYVNTFAFEPTALKTPLLFSPTNEDLAQSSSSYATSNHNDTWENPSSKG